MMYQKEYWRDSKEQRVCAIDLDGCLVDYPKCYVDFVNEKTGNNFLNLNEAKEKLLYNEYRRIKREYRTCGAKATLPIKQNAKELIEGLKDRGYKIIILTSRPYRIYKSIWKDTLQWLENNKIKIDGIIWEKEKHWAVLYEFPYLKFLVEDNAEIANQVAKIGYKVYVVTNEYNNQTLENNCKRVDSLLEILYSEDERNVTKRENNS